MMPGDMKWLVSSTVLIFVLQHQTSSCARTAWQRGPGKGKYFVLPATQEEFCSPTRGSTYCRSGLLLCTFHGQRVLQAFKASSHTPFTLADPNLLCSFQALWKQRLVCHRLGYPLKKVSWAFLSIRSKKEPCHMLAFKFAVSSLSAPCLIIWMCGWRDWGPATHSGSGLRQVNSVEEWGFEPHSSISETMASLFVKIWLW